MNAKRGTRRLVALMFTDMVGYSRLASQNEKLALELLEEHRELFRKTFPAYGGNENKTVGDAFFIEFGSAVEAVNCAIELQTKLYERQVFTPKEHQLQVRIGIHLGDIIDFEGDSYGDGVNIAARVENKAEPGGVFITQQVFDQVLQNVEMPIKKVGMFDLKNISKPTAIFRICFPWEAYYKPWYVRAFANVKRKFSHKHAHHGATWWETNGLSFARLAVIFGILGFSMGTVAVGIKGAFNRGGQERRAPAAEGVRISSSSPKVDLTQGWKYTLLRPGQNVQNIVKAPGLYWEDFDVMAPHLFSERIAGEYWMKNEFMTPDEYANPAIVLGLVASNHRVYLNGTYIGGSTNFMSFEYYTFDPRILKRNGPNTLIVWARTKPVLNPGINSLPSVGSYLAELANIHPKMSWERTAYLITRSVYLAFAVLMTFLCLVYYLSDRNKTHYLYFSVYLGLGALALIYYNAVVSIAFDYQFRRFLKVFSLCISSFVLLSAYLHLRKRPFYEMTNNAIALMTSLAIAATLLLPRDSRQVIVYYNAMFNMVMGFTMVWIIGVTVDLITVFGQASKRLETSLSDRTNLVLIWIFGVSTGVLLYIGSYHSLLVVPAYRIRIQDLGMLYPFLFGTVVFLAGLIDYVEKIRAVKYAKEKDNLILNIVKIIRDAKDIGAAITSIQDQVSRFVHAERSTVFLVGLDENRERLLKASYFFGGRDVRHHVEKRIQPKDGIIGYAWTTRAPLLIRDLRQDLRFQKYLKHRASGHRYKTDSCMIFPLMVRNELIGILTVADKMGGVPFSPMDFSIMHSISKDIGLLISNSQLQEQLDEYLAA